MNHLERFPELKGGLLLPLVESFYTIQGEGYHAGKAAYFIRLGGCDVGCSWCDAKETWDLRKFPPVEVEKIVADALACPARSIVITGGEPLRYPLDILCGRLTEENLEIFLETSGSEPLTGRFDWICLSPKKNRPPLKENYRFANELKVIIEEPEDFAWAELNRGKTGKDCKLYLQPEWSRSEKILPEIIGYVKEHPAWNISLQTHKYMKIP